MALALALKVNSAAIPNLKASVDGNQLIITNTAGNTLATSFELFHDGDVVTATATVLEATDTIVPSVNHRYFYTPVNPNVRVDEATQVDTLQLFNGNSPADDEGTLTSTIIGLGMSERR
jgi:hypothetical protein